LRLPDRDRGIFGPANLTPIDSLLNGLGLIPLAVTGIMMWFQTRPNRKNEPKKLTILPEKDKKY
jgi:hypothetical protein